MYVDPQFQVHLEGQDSSWLLHKSGIRQGCPLSPYLFIIVMTALFADIHHSLPRTHSSARLPFTSFDEVLFADDTILFSPDPRKLNQLIAAAELCGARYG